MTDIDARRGRTTIEDVAAAAGVSVATVSRALRGLPNVAPTTRDRVVQIAESMGYRPDPAASRLAAGRTRTVAVVVPNLSGWYFSQVVGGAEAVLSEMGYDLLVMGVSGAEARTRFLESALNLHRRVDGLIIVDIRVASDEADRLREADIDVVSIGFECEGLSSVMLDDVGVGEKATKHLLDLGHRDIAIMEGLPDDPLRFAVPNRRREGYEAAHAAAGVGVAERERSSGNFSVEGGADAMATLLKSADPPTAVFAMSDEMAMGAIRTAREAGISVPDDLSIIGVDDHDLATVLDLTTVRQDVAGHGAVAARWITDDLTAGVRRIRREVPRTQLVVRGTTAPPSS